MRHPGYKYSHALTMACEAQTVSELIARGIEGLEIVLELLFRDKEVGDIPFHAHVEDAGGTVDILVKIKDIATVGGYKVGYDCNYAGLIGTVHAQDCGVGMFLVFHTFISLGCKVSKISHKTWLKSF